MEISRADHLDTRRSLLSRLRNFDDSKSWQDFSRAYSGLVRAFASKAGLCGWEADEVVQNTLITVSKNIQEFRYDPAKGSFKGWLMQIVRCRVADQFRKRTDLGADQTADDEGADTRRTRTIERIADPRRPDLDRIWDGEWAQAVMAAATARVKEEVSARQYQIFDLHVLKGWPVQKVCGTLRVSATQVYLAKLRVGRVMAKEVTKVQSGRL